MVENLSNFKEVSGFEGRYLVSEYGKIYSNHSNKFLVTFISNNGYERVNINYSGKVYKRSIHRLVAEAFCEGYSEELQVNHIDADRLNNRASNLEWVTAKENTQDAIRRKTHMSIVKPRSKAVSQLSTCGKFIKKFTSASEASRLTGIDRQNISATCLGVRNKAGGFTWKFA